MEPIAICFDNNVNPDKFPLGYVFELTNSEKEYVVKNIDHLETLKFSHATVKGFTEQGHRGQDTDCHERSLRRQLAPENAQAYLWCEPGNPQIFFGNNKGIQRINRVGGKRSSFPPTRLSSSSSSIFSLKLWKFRGKIVSLPPNSNIASTTL